MPIFVPRQRKRRVLDRAKRSQDEAAPASFDTNAAEIRPRSVIDRDDAKKALAEQLRSQQNVRSSKKAKRLDKYIDKKLRKDESLELIKKLASSKVDTSLLRASSSLGVKNLPKRDRLRQALNETRAGINVEGNRGLLFQDESSDDHSSGSSHSRHAPEATLQRGEKCDVKPSIGAGLKRPLESGSDGQPIIKRRQRTKKHLETEQSIGSIPWEGFSSDQDSLSSAASQRTESDEESHDSLSEFESSDREDGSQDSSTDDDDDDAPDVVRARKEKSSIFKAWATQQVNDALDIAKNESNIEALNNSGMSKKSSLVTRQPEQDPLPPELEVVDGATERKAFSVKVDRTPEIQEARLGLPVVAEEQKIMESIYNNPVVVIWGATGSGKTTQVPQFLYEAGFGDPSGPNPGMIGVTQPRRVAAVSMAKRVALELADVQGKVAYQIRFDSSVSSKTAVKFMTDGILIREIANDFSLSKYSVIIIDEAHERSANTDILIGMVSRIVDLRENMSKEDSTVKPLKMIIMSATLRINDFLENPNLFRSGRPPLVQAEGRQYPVTVHFSRKTQRDYVDEAFHKICRGHKRLPAGGMLVFLTGQNEINSLSKRLKDALVSSAHYRSEGRRAPVSASEIPFEAEDMEIETFGKNIIDLDENEDEEEQDDDPFDEIEDEDFEIEGTSPPSSEVYILPLYSQLPTKDQLRVFQPPANNARLIVLATNVAETSLTIPNIRYVFDCGRAKSRTFDRDTGIQSFDIGWISRASASQRAGRAGRTGPGHCYRLYSSAIYERDFEEYAQPEILRMPVEGIVLQLKSMDLQHVVNFPFPTPPDRHSLAKAEKLLTHLGAVAKDGKLTDLGRDLSAYPLSPRFAKMLSIGHQHGCILYTIALVAGLATPSIYIPENHLDLSIPVRSEDDIYTNEDRLADNARTSRKSAYNHAHHLLSTHSPISDALKVLTALCAHAHASDKANFCSEMFLSTKALSEATSLYTQLISAVHTSHPLLLPITSQTALQNLPSPTKAQIAALHQFVAAAFIDQIAILATAHPSPPSDLGRKPSRAIDAPYLPLFSIIPTDKPRADIDIADIAVYIHPSSILAHHAVKDLPTYIVYHHLQRAAPSTIGDANAVKQPKTRMHPLTSVSGKQVANLARGTSLLEYGKPIGKVEEVEGKAGRERTCLVIPSLVGEKRGGSGWPLPGVKVLQVKGNRGWEVKEVIG